MPDNKSAFKYKAFISYSHRDESWGRWLHRSIEGYRVPKGVIGRETIYGPSPSGCSLFSATGRNSPPPPT